MNVRAAAAQAVALVLKGRSLDDALAALGDVSPADRPLLRALAYGVLRDHRSLAALVDAMVERPLPDDPELRALLRVGLFQLRSLQVAPHAAVNETVAATEILQKGWARGLVNALLRRYQRERAALEATLADDPALRLSYPAWLARAVVADWGERAPEILAAGNERGPLTLRVNRRRATLAQIEDELRGQNLPSHPVATAPDALVLATAVPVDELPGFADGRISIQDAAAQLAVELLALRSGDRVLDACAAPGGKGAHALEHCDCRLLALDVDALRLQRAQETFARLGLAAELRAGDVLQPAAWWDGTPFDRILLDAPCSGTGVIRRHPDIKWLRRADDVPALAARQHAMLQALWPLLQPGGRLVYATCSILDAEGAGVIAKFLDGAPDAAPLEIAADWGEPYGRGRRLAPGGDFDGFYYAVLEKRA